MVDDEPWCELVQRDKARLVSLAAGDRAALNCALKELGITKVGHRARAEAWLLRLKPGGSAADAGTPAAPIMPPHRPPEPAKRDYRPFAPLSLARTLARFHHCEPVRDRGQDFAQAHEWCDPASPIVAQWVAGTTILGSAELEVQGVRWMRVIAPKEGYVRCESLQPIGTGFVTYELAPRPSAVHPEPPRGADADVTFTVTFNGRITQLIDAMSAGTLSS